MSASQHAPAVLPVIEAELVLRCWPLGQLKSFELAVLPLHLPVMSASQHVPATLPLIVAAFVLLCWPEGQVKPEQASSQHAATVVPVMEAELAL
jgi:hypothetical protein